MTDDRWQGWRDDGTMRWWDDGMMGWHDEWKLRRWLTVWYILLLFAEYNPVNNKMSFVWVTMFRYAGYFAAQLTAAWMKNDISSSAAQKLSNFVRNINLFPHSNWINNSSHQKQTLLLSSSVSPSRRVKEGWRNIFCHNVSPQIHKISKNAVYQFHMLSVLAGATDHHRQSFIFFPFLDGFLVSSAWFCN